MDLTQLDLRRLRVAHRSTVASSSVATETMPGVGSGPFTRKSMILSERSARSPGVSLRLIEHSTE